MSGGATRRTVVKTVSLTSLLGYTLTTLPRVGGTSALIRGPSPADPRVEDTQSAGNKWTQEKKLTANDANKRDRLGVTVSLDGNRALVGAVVNGIKSRNSSLRTLMPTIASVRRCHLTGTARSSERSEKMCSGTTKRVRRTCSQKNLRKILPQ
ncbi:hypothetical protein BRC68_15145 [Halobacteriales archaeon QH_6_64_20]|nr:MAG: hypothetical protein BRC68_15145 [Halobacteriales archaeon QH_6_64_20]